jgi:K+-sensing histidine kinase KdpD
MTGDYPAEDGNAVRLERRWFAAYRAAAKIRAEYGALAVVGNQRPDAWWTARSQLSHLEALCEALGDELSAIDAPESPVPPAARQRSAA